MSSLSNCHVATAQVHEFPISPPSSPPSESGLTVIEIPHAQCNPFDRLEMEIGSLVDRFSPGARDHIKASMDLDIMNKQKLTNLESELRKMGDIDAANNLVAKMLDASRESTMEVFPMRRHIKDIAEYLCELRSQDALASAESMQEIVSEIATSAKKAFESAEQGQKKYAAATAAVKKVSEDYAKKVRDHQEKAKASEEQARIHDKLASQYKKDGNKNARGSVACGVGAVGSGGVGACVAGGVIAAGQAAVVATGLGGLAVVFGAIATHQYRSKGKHRDLEAKANEQADEHKKKQHECKQVAETAKSALEKSEKVVQVAQEHMAMWDGISAAAVQASLSFEQLSAMNHINKHRRAKFEQRMNEFSEQLLMFVTAIDEYMYFLSTTSYFPPNLNLKMLIGAKQYHAIEKSMNTAKSTTGSLTGGEPAGASDKMV